MASGADAFRRGDYGQAERDWRQADELYANAGDAGGRLDAWLNLGAVQQQTGKFPVAENTLLNAQATARESSRADKLPGINNALGVLYTFTRRPELAEKALKEALALAQEQQADPLTVAGIRNNLGNLYAVWAEVLKDQGKPDTYGQAFDEYAASADLARQAGDPTLAAKATANAALSAGRGGQFEKANDLAARRPGMPATCRIRWTRPTCSSPPARRIRSCSPRTLRAWTPAACSAGRSKPTRRRDRWPRR